jgi:hypothetical protein
MVICKPVHNDARLVDSHCVEDTRVTRGSTNEGSLQKHRLSGFCKRQLDISRVQGVCTADG